MLNEKHRPIQSDQARVLDESVEFVKPDNVNHPNHYTTGNIETIKYIQDKLTDEEFRGYIKGNVLKYLSREKHKNGDEDIRKAGFYLNRLIKKIEFEEQK